MIYRSLVTCRTAHRENYETYRCGIWGREPNPCHNSDHHVLLRVELPGVKTPCVAKGGELPRRENCFQEFTSRKGEQLNDIGRDNNAGLASGEELVDKPSVEL